MDRKRKPLSLSRKPTILFQFLLCWPYCVRAQQRLRGSPKQLDWIKTLLLDNPNDIFMPLECNSNLDQQECRPWSSVFGSDGTTVFNRRIVIPCGECIVIDGGLHARNVVLNDGLDIQGKLVFPPNVEIKVRTTSILVQGELHMTSYKGIDGLPAITVTWMDHPENSSSQYSSRYPCGQVDGEECDHPAERPFVVAGGRVVIQGLPSADMPTWVPLLDIDNSKTGWHVEASEYEAYSEPEPGCPSDGILLHHRFTEPPPDYISSSSSNWGSFSEWTGRSLMISKQTHSEDGFVVDTNGIRHCLLPKVTYLLTAKVRLPQGQGLTACARAGQNCISILSKYTSEMEAKEFVERIWMENESHQFEYGTDLVVRVYVNFLGKSLHENTIRSHIFHIQGPSTGEDLELLEFTLQTPPREAFVPPQKICADLVPGNNNAELFDVSSFPIRTNSKYVQIQTKSEYSNKYFAITGREFVSRDPELSVDENWSFLGISWNIPPSCVRAKATYRFRAKVRVHSESPITIKWNVKGWEGRRPVLAQVALCPPSQGEWVQCSGSIIAFPNEIVHSHRLEMLAETLETFRHNYDVDDLSFELMEGPVDRLLLPSSIHQKWLTGAHLLITSSTPEWDEWEVVEIKDVVVHDSDSVKVEISRPIKSPVTARESDVYSTEVALLSRNIVFENGGHFTVLRTPGVAQVIEGADFSRFGIAGHPGRHPIYFDNCWDAEGTIVSKNTIRHSRHRGLVLNATSNVRVTSNIAFNTTGHCFVLESGIEQGNSFENNLAAFTTTEMPRVADRVDDKSDDHPAAFWISNPTNDFIGNVATGTDGSGFSFQFDASPLGHRVMDEFGIPVNTLNLGVFEDNIVHSVSSAAVHFSGYRPHKAKIAGLRAFLVDGDLFELVNSYRITIVNGIFDKEVNSATGLSFESPSIIDVRGCIDGDDEAIATMNALVDEGKREPAMITPSAPSVFGLQEYDL